MLKVLAYLARLLEVRLHTAHHADEGDVRQSRQLLGQQWTWRAMSIRARVLYEQIRDDGTYLGNSSTLEFKSLRAPVARGQGIHKTIGDEIGADGLDNVE
jgi:hypothetical protein